MWSKLVLKNFSLNIGNKQWCFTVNVVTTVLT